MSSPHEHLDAVADKAMKEQLDSLMVLHRQAFNSVMVLDREQRKETANEQRKNGIAALLQEGVDTVVVETALNSVMALHREALDLALKKNRDEHRRKETANNEQQNNNEIIHLKKEVVQWKETAEDWKKELVQWKEIAEDWNKELVLWKGVIKQRDNEIADLKKEVVQWKETAEQQNNAIIDFKEEFKQYEEKWSKSGSTN